MKKLTKWPSWWNAVLIKREKKVSKLTVPKCWPISQSAAVLNYQVLVNRPAVTITKYHLTKSTSNMVPMLESHKNSQQHIFLQLIWQWPLQGWKFYWRTKILCFLGHPMKKDMIHFHLQQEPANHKDLYLCVSMGK